jgi:hypothetical protein
MLLITPKKSDLRKTVYTKEALCYDVFLNLIDYCRSTLKKLNRAAHAGCAVRSASRR